MDKTQSQEFAKNVYEWITDKNGKDVKILDIGELSDLGDYFIIASGNSDRQVNAIADYIQDKASEMGIEPKNIEGLRTGRWVLLDYFDVIIHLFHEDEREFYNLEKIWKDAPQLEFEEEITE